MAGYNPVWGRDPWTSIATFTADTSAAGYPASNLASVDLNQVWRATQKTAVITWTTSRPVPFGFLAIIRHNMTQGAAFRLEIFANNDLTGAKYDSATDTALPGGSDVWPTAYTFDQLDFEDDNWLTWQYRTEELSNQSWDRPIWISDVRYLHQSGRLTLTNSFNTANLQVGRIEIARGYQMSRGISVQASSGTAPNSIVTPADGGRKYGQLKMKPKVFQAAFPSLPRDEAELIKVLKRKHDIVPEQGIYFHPYPTDPAKWLANSGYMRFADLALHQVASALRDSVPVNLEEIL